MKLSPGRIIRDFLDENEDSLYKYEAQGGTFNISLDVYRGEVAFTISSVLQPKKIIKATLN
jgi:hypothetical protein